MSSDLPHSSLVPPDSSHDGGRLSLSNIPSNNDIEESKGEPEENRGIYLSLTNNQVYALMHQLPKQFKLAEACVPK